MPSALGGKWKKLIDVKTNTEIEGGKEELSSESLPIFKSAEKKPTVFTINFARDTLLKLLKTMPKDTKVKFEFKGSDKPVVVRVLEEKYNIKGLILPVV